jgi:hypothetical protein
MTLALPLLCALLASWPLVPTFAGERVTAIAPPPALEMTRKDRLAVLYSNQVIFDRRGEPLVSVRVTDAQPSVQFSSRGRLTLLPSADDGARILTPAGATWRVHVEEATLGKTRWWVAAERLPAGDMAAAARSRAVGRRAVAARGGGGHRLPHGRAARCAERLLAAEF